MDAAVPCTLPNIFQNETVPAGGSVTKGPFPVEDAAGLFSLKEKMSGDGRLTFEWLGVLIDGETPLKPNSGGEILSDQTKTSGADGDGHNWDGFTVKLAKRIYIRAREVGGSNSATVDWAHLRRL